MELFSLLDLTFKPGFELCHFYHLTHKIMTCDVNVKSFVKINENKSKRGVTTGSRVKIKERTNSGQSAEPELLRSAGKPDYKERGVNTAIADDHSKRG